MQSDGKYNWRRVLLPWARSERLWLVLGAVAMAVQTTWWWVPGRDSSVYMSMARHIAHGELQVRGGRNLMHSLGYPVAISPCFALGDRPFLAISLFQLGFLIVFMVFLWRWLRSIVGGPAALLVGLITANVSLWTTRREMLSESVYLPLLILAAVAMGRMVRADSTRQTVGWGAAAAVLTAMLGLVRQPGVLLIGGLCLALAWQARHRKIGWVKAAVCAAGVSLLPAAVMIASRLYYHSIAVATGGETYESDLTRLAGAKGWAWVVQEGLRQRIGEFGRLLVPGMYKAYSRPGQWLNICHLIYIPLAAAVMVGWWRVARRRPDPLLWTFPIYVAFHVLVPYDQDTRYLLPMLPVLVVSLWTLLKPLGRWRRAAVVCLVAAHLGVAAGYWIASLRLAKYDRQWAAVRELIEPITADPRPVASLGIDEKFRLMVEFDLNRLVTDLKRPVNLPQAEGWLLESKDAPPPEGFVVRKIVGPWQLLQRSPRPN